jgi:hypothetical protein
MSNDFTPEQIVSILLALSTGFWLAYASIESAKAKAFNEGYKRGRASNSYVREIAK